MKYRDAKEKTKKTQLSRVDTENKILRRMDRDMAVSHQRTQSAKRRQSLSYDPTTTAEATVSIKNELKEWRAKKELEMAQEAHEHAR